MAIDVFHDLEVYIGAHRVGQGYPVQLILDRVRVFPSGMMDAEVASWRPTGDPAEDGRRLLAYLLADDPVRDSWREAKGAAPQRRVRIRIDAKAAELHALPWELVRDEGRALAADAHTPFSRFVPSDQVVHTRPTRRPVRLLVAIANPQGLSERSLVELDFEAQATAIRDALRDFPHGPEAPQAPPTSNIQHPIRSSHDGRRTHPHHNGPGVPGKGPAGSGADRQPRDPRCAPSCAGFRSAWYRVNPGERLNEPGDTNPFPQAFIFIKGTGVAKIGDETVPVKADEAYSIPRAPITWSGRRGTTRVSSSSSRGVKRHEPGQHSFGDVASTTHGHKGETHLCPSSSSARRSCPA
jgi:mannose-6-phosphate isomerase-like protein (cupin superfamily)